MRTVKWVRSYKDILKDCPTKVKFDADLRGYYYKPTNTIYLIRGKSKPMDLHHEIYHSIHRHSEHPRDPSDFINHEIGANIYSYKKVGMPKHILGKLIGFYNDLLVEEYRVGNDRALSLIHRALVKNKAPETWMKDFDTLKKKAQKVNG